MFLLQLKHKHGTGVVASPLSQALQVGLIHMSRNIFEVLLLFYKRPSLRRGGMPTGIDTLSPRVQANKGFFGQTLCSLEIRNKLD